LDNLEALREAIEIIRNGIDEDSLIADHEYAREIISQLEKHLSHETYMTIEPGWEWTGKPWKP
jgi:hypothetical protein